MNSGVYEIVHSATGRRYIGSALDFGVRWRAHLSRLRKGTHHAPHLQHAWNKRGENAFSFQKLLICAPRDLLFYEQRALNGLKPEYNVARVAGSSRGVRQSAETIAKRAHALRGKRRKVNWKPTDEQRAKMSLAQRGRRLSAETIAKMSAAHKGKIITPEARAKMAAAKRGKALSPEHRAKISAAGIGRTQSLEARAKLAAFHAGKVVSPETREKIANARTGKKASEAARANMSAAQSARQARLKLVTPHA